MNPFDGIIRTEQKEEPPAGPFARFAYAVAVVVTIMMLVIMLILIVALAKWAL